MTGNKNPYEVRLDVMKMAQEMLRQETALEERIYLQKLEALNKANSDLHSISSLEKPRSYTEQDIINKSQVLYSFISNTSKN